MPALSRRLALLVRRLAVTLAPSLLLLAVLAGDARAQTGIPAPRTRVFGVVFDSVGMHPLRGAIVQFVSASDPAQARSVTSDDRGAFAFDDVDRGTYLLGFIHPKLDSLSLTAPLARVDVRAPGELQVSLSIPSSETLLTRFCGPTAVRDTIGLFQGRVRLASGGMLAQPAKVRVQWGELVLGTRGIERRTPSVLATTSPEGAFAVCGVPAGSMMMVRAFSGTDSSGYVELELPISGYLNRDLAIAPVTRVSPNDSFPRLVVSRGDGTLRGVVRNFSGKPVAGARVGIWSSGLEVATNAGGQFALSSLPNGTYTLEARAVGFRVQRQPVDIASSVSAPTDITLEPLPSLDTVRVKASRLYTTAAMAEFEMRRKAGGGYFLDEAAIEKRQAVAMADLFRIAPGVTVTPGQQFGDQVFMRGSGGYCVPDLFVNGNRVMSDGGNLDQIGDPREVRGVEVYNRAGSVPIQFQTVNGCGAIVIWVGARGR